jgi:hypothetical protein
VFDIIWGGMLAYTAIALTTWPYEEGVDGVVVVGFSWAAISGISAAVGINKSHRCREAKRALVERLEQDGAAVERGRNYFCR